MFGTLVIQLAPGSAHQRDERPRVQVAFRILGTTAQRRVGEIGDGVGRAKALEPSAGIRSFAMASIAVWRTPAYVGAKSRLRFAASSDMR